MQYRAVLPDDVKAFLRAFITSIWALELLLFLRGRAESAWSVATLTRELHASEPVVRGSLGLFRAAGLVSEDAGGKIRFAPASPDLDKLVGDVAECYATHPVSVSDEIYAPDSRIRNFADAFRLKKD